jgi:aryl-alcohol dehydrogenase-like predicted oxidoreductase
MFPEGTNAAAQAKPEEHGIVNWGGLSRKHIFDSIKASLERLQLDYVDVLQCHRFDENTPIEETMVALHDVVKAGLARYIGMSSCYAWQFHQMQSKYLIIYISFIWLTLLKTMRSTITLHRSFQCRTITRFCTARRRERCFLSAKSVLFF